jgi:hypothetical protein
MKKSLIALAAMAAAGCSMAARSRNYDDEARGHELRALNAGGLEASLKGALARAFVAPAPCDGRAVMITDKVVLGAGGGLAVGTPAIGDTLDFFVPAGTRVGDLAFICDDADTAASALASIGYRPVNSASALAENATYFAAAGAFAQAAGRVECVFKPIKFEEDVWIEIKYTAAPTGLAGNPEIHMVLIGSSEGPK